MTFPADYWIRIILNFMQLNILVLSITGNTYIHYRKKKKKDLNHLHGDIKYIYFKIP